MTERLCYKSYTGSIEFSEKDNKFFGTLQGIDDYVQYEGKSRDELECEFEMAVDIYLLLCNDAGKSPDKVSEKN